MSIEYDFSHPPEAVLHAMTDHDAVLARCAALGEEVRALRVQHIGTEVVVQLERAIRSEVPKVLQRFFNPVQITHLHETWWRSDGDWRGQHDVQIVNQPIEIHAAFELLPTATGCRFVIAHRATAKVPLVRRQVEKLLSKELAKGFTGVCDYLRDALAR